MGRRGPQPARPDLKIIGGRGPGRDGKPRDSGGRTVAPPPAFKRLPPDKPKTLSPIAAAHWDEIVPELARLDILKPNDVGGLTIMCEAWAMRQQALAELEAHAKANNGSLTIQANQGRLRHPAVGIAATAWKEYRQWAVLFGLTPSSEGNLKPEQLTAMGRDAGDGEEDNPFAN